MVEQPAPWFPLAMLPGVIANLAPALLSYHLAQLAAAPLEGGSWLGQVILLLAFTAIGGLTATVAWGRAPR